MTGLSQFHFLRPEWLLLLLPAGFLVWSILRRHDDQSAWQGVIEKHLLKHLLVYPEENSRGLKPVLIFSLLLLTGITAIAGPAWQKEPTPFTEDQSALIIVLKVTPEMLARDVQPSRLQRANHKIADLLEARSGSKNALIAYAGSAHLVMPLTSDNEIINGFAAELSPSLMPLEGDSPSAAIRLANQRIEKSGLAGSILLIADQIDRGELDALQAINEKGSADVHILAIAGGPDIIPPADSPPAPALNLDDMQAAAVALGATLTLVSIDNSDVFELVAQVEKSFANAPSQKGTRWRDAGYYLLPLCMILLLLLFRQGAAVPLGYGFKAGS